MKLEELYKVVNGATRLVVFTGNGEWIAIYDGKNDIPELLNGETISALLPDMTEDDTHTLKVILNAEDMVEILGGALERLLRDRLNDLENGEDVDNVLFNLMETIDTIDEARRAYKEL